MFLLPVVLLVILGFIALWAIGAVFWVILSTLFIGLIIGALGRLVVPGRQRIGLLATVLIGFVGAIGGSLIGSALGVAHVLTLLIEVGVAAALVALYSGRRRRSLTATRRSLGGGW